jgi:hypothetical protein
MVDVNSILVGQRLVRVECSGSHVFNFEFELAKLQVECLWRIINETKLLLTSSDDKQKYGLPAQIDALAGAIEYLSGQVVASAQIHEPSADLLLTFRNGVSLQVLSEFSGYEAWNLSNNGNLLVAMGGIVASH